jgi:hypothetical protein
MTFGVMGSNPRRHDARDLDEEEWMREQGRSPVGYDGGPYLGVAFLACAAGWYDVEFSIDIGAPPS